MSVHSLYDDMAFACACGSVKFNLLRSAGIECAKCGIRFGVWDANPKAISVEKERADYAWRNTNILEKARQEERAKCDDLLAALEEIGNTACGEASHQYMACAAIAKAKP